MAQLKLADGREYALLVDYEAMIAAEGVYGKPLPKLTEDLAAGFIGAVRALVYGALTAKHPTIKPSDVTALLDTDGEAVSTALAEAVAAFKGDSPADPAKASPKPRKRTAKAA